MNATDRRKTVLWHTGQPRGFLLMVVIGLLAVMLAICVGFLSYTRGEVNAVATIRDKNDGSDIMLSAQDLMLGVIMNDLMDGTGKMDSDKYLSGAANGQWWLRPYQKGLGEALRGWWAEGAARPYFANRETDWVYLPDDFFPEGGIRGRYQILVMDANSVININDWNEDCAPTQCQMAHMIAGAYGENSLERYRAYRDGGAASWNSYGGRQCPLRYHEGWRVASRTTRYTDYINTYSQGPDNSASDYWLTTNSVWLSLFGPDQACIRAILPSDGIPLYDANKRLPASIGPLLTSVTGSLFYMPPDYPGQARSWLPAIPGGYGNRFYDNGNLGWCLSGFGLMGYIDPDTGRSPVNVNTCYNSGEKLPMETYNSGVVRPCYTIEGVFNVDALRLVVQLFDFYVDHDANAGTPAERISMLATNPVTLAADADYFVTKIPLWTDAQKLVVWQKHEELRTKMAYRYQEALCRYFTGSYAHSTSLKFPPFDTSSGGKRTYNATYPAVTGVTNACGTMDYSSTRFPVGLDTFRANVRSDLLAMASGMPTYVSFDAAGNPTNVPQGRLDLRTAEAVYDTIVPGQASLGLLASRPLDEIRDWKLARQEDINDQLDPYGRWSDNPNIKAMATTGINHLDHKGVAQDVSPKGNLIADSAAPPGPYDREDADDTHLPSFMDFYKLNTSYNIPYRQMVCADDCLSTELTVSSTNFIFIINAQIVDRQSMKVDPNDPTKHRDLFWNQWGVVVEIAPDLKNEGVSVEYYATARPKFYKTALHTSPDGMDFNCPSLKNGNLAFATRDNTTYVKDWKADIRGIASGDEASFYTGNNQIDRRVVIRSVWSLNQGVMR